jgi:hypothetical protein
MLATGLIELARAWRKGVPARLNPCRTVLAAALVALVDRQLFRESGYFVIVAPLTAAFGARLLAGPPGWRPATLPSWQRASNVAARALSISLLLITVVAVGGFIRGSDFFEVGYLLEHLPQTFRRLATSPPIDGLASAEEIIHLDRAAWLALDYGTRSNLMVRYMHDCAAPGDRVLVSGQTPYQISYYVERPLAAGHLYWHDRWRSDPAREAQSFALLSRQSVPFSFSTHDAVLDDMRPYPHIREYMQRNYVEIEGSNGRLLVDSRRRPVREYWTLGFPCFR